MRNSNSGKFVKERDEEHFACEKCEGRPASAGHDGRNERDPLDLKLAVDRARAGRLHLRPAAFASLFTFSRGRVVVRLRRTIAPLRRRPPTGDQLTRRAARRVCPRRPRSHGRTLFRTAGAQLSTGLFDLAQRPGVDPDPLAR